MEICVIFYSILFCFLRLYLIENKKIDLYCLLALILYLSIRLDVIRFQMVQSAAKKSAAITERQEA